MREERGAWYLLTGLIIGGVIGLLYAWLVRPIQYVDTTPAALRADFKDHYRALIAAAYVANPDLVRARARLELLADEDIYRALAEQAQRTLADGSDPNQARALGLLAVSLGQPTSGAPPLQVTPADETDASLAATQDLLTQTPGSPIASQTNMTGTLDVTMAVNASTTPLPEISPDSTAPSTTPTPRSTSLPTATRTALPTRTPTPTPGAPFTLERQDLVCDPDLGAGLLQIQALDAAGEPVPGVEVVVVWETGEDHFFTGLKPELGLGYADFNMTPGVSYLVRLAAGGLPLSELTAEECETSRGERYWGSWSLVFVQP